MKDAWETGNQLSEALSPYLLQHKDNPVHWREWGPEALAESLKTGRPIFLSIGYAACHWCHVMAHESFEDEETARMMNSLFVSIKVDRQERPDIDQIYMTALQALGVQGGWPLSMFLTPAGEPFYGGTYFPKVRAYGRPSFKDVLFSVARAYAEDPELIRRNTQSLALSLQTYLVGETTQRSFQPTDFDRYVTESMKAIDPENGGIGQQPKFPNMPLWDSFWRWGVSADDASSRNVAVHWLTALCQGGLYDHLGGGYARYTVDREWLVPHFEKMLYDNAQILRALAAAHRQGPGTLFRDRIAETIYFLKRDMLTPDGALAASLDADSEGEEGRFYVWNPADLADLEPLFHRVYDVTPTGNWEGKTILNRSSSPYPLSKEDEATLSFLRQRLFALRQERVPPARDDKILTDWNAYAVRAIADCGFTCERSDWISWAEEIYRSVSESASEGRLPHARRGNQRSFPAFLSDYAAMANAALSLYALTSHDAYRLEAAQWIQIIVEDHADEQGSYFMTSRDSADLLLRTYQDRDEATPAASSQVLEAMQRYALLFDDLEMQSRADRLGQCLWGRVSSQPHGASSILNALYYCAEPKKLLLPTDRPDLINVARNEPDPARMDVLLKRSAHPAIPGNDDEVGSGALLCTGRVCLPAVLGAS